jgi:hypothetical protein
MTPFPLAHDLGDRRTEIRFLAVLSSPVYPAQPLGQGEQDNIALMVKRPGYKADSSPPCVQVKNMRN